MKKKFLSFGTTILLLGVLIAPVSQVLANEEFNLVTPNGNTLYVGGTGPGNYTKIQYAIDNASNGDTIFVYSGIYYENVRIKKSIDLVGEDKNNTIIEGGRKDDVVYITTSDVSVKNFYLNNSGVYDTDSGIRIYGEVNNITIKCNIIKNNYFGICVGDRYQYKKIMHVVILNNFIQNKRYGVALYCCYENTISNNIFINNGLYIPKAYTRDNIVLNNTVNGLPLLYFEKQSDKIIQANVGQIILVKCDNITVTNQCLDKRCEVGIQLFCSKNCNIINNYITNKTWGIFSLNSEVNRIRENFIENVSTGIFLDGSNGHLISLNKINNSWKTIYIEESSDNIISYNHLTNSSNGLYFGESNDNIIRKNQIENCRDYGIDLFFRCNRNQFLNNTIRNCRDAGIHIYGTNNIWFDLASNKNVISGNELINNWVGISIEEAGLTKIYSNNIFQNNYGVEVISAKYNKIFNNNIFENTEEDALLKNSFTSRFNSNYWNETKKVHFIKGGIYRYNFWTESYEEILSMTRFDWHPAKVPYDLT